MALRRVVFAAFAVVPLSAAHAASEAGEDTQTATSASVQVPSGQPVTLSEVLLDDAPGALWARFRFVAPQIADDTDQATSLADMEHLCTAIAVPYLRHYDIKAERVVVSFSDRVLPFGSSAPDATQFFETYLIEGASCVWEGF